MCWSRVVCSGEPNWSEWGTEEPRSSSITNLGPHPRLPRVNRTTPSEGIRSTTRNSPNDPLLLPIRHRLEYDPITVGTEGHRGPVQFTVQKCREGARNYQTRRDIISSGNRTLTSPQIATFRAVPQDKGQEEFVQFDQLTVTKQ